MKHPTEAIPSTQQDIFKKMVEKWPSAVVATSEVRKFSGGAVSGKSLANQRCLGQPVPESFLIGSKRVYPVESLAEWLRGRSQGQRSA